MARTRSEFRALLHRYQMGTCTPTEKRRIEDWYAGLGTERPLELTPDEQAKLTATVWQRIAQRTTLPSADAGTTARASWPAARVRWAAVAVLVLVLGAGLAGTYWAGGLAPWQAGGSLLASTKLPAPAWVRYRNTLTHPARVALPDGSTVTLTPTSSLKYPRAFAGARRTVYLTGEAFFEVFHDTRHPFSVYTQQVVATVLGTSFRVRAYAGQPETRVQVRTGAVRVSPRLAAPLASAGTPSLVVRPNQQAVYSALRQQLRRELVPQPVLLAPQAFAFDDRPVAEVLTALQKGYGIAIEYDAAALRHCTINLSLGQEPLFEKLDIICETLGASYEKADGRILFHSQPCPTE